MAQRDRELFLIEMQAGVGLSAAPATLVDFENSIGGAEKPPMRRSMATYRVKMPDGTWRFSSTCGLKIREAMRRAGFKPRWLLPDYIPSSVMTNLEQEGVRARAKHPANPGSLPSSGDVFALGWGDPNDAHVAVVETITVNADGTVTVIAIEAGQIDPQLHQACARKKHTWTWHEGRGPMGQYLDRSVSITPGIVDGTHARDVSWWIDMSLLPAGGPTQPFTTARAPSDAAPPAPPPQGITVGSKGPEVARWQGIVKVDTDGDFQAVTFNATKAWQLAHGLPVTGVVGQDSWAVALAENPPPPPAPPPASSPSPTVISTPTTLSSLPNVVLQRGASGEAVKLWQPVVGAKPDGRFGPETEELTRAWQIKHGLTGDGRVGPATWAAAFRAGVPNPSATPTPGRAPSAAVLEGIDVSHYQASARFEEVAKAGVGFVFVKLGQGSHLIPPYEDKSAAKLCAGVRDAGLLLGGYHYEMARPEDARVQAEDFFEAWERNRCSLAELDVEWKNNEKASATQFRDATATLLERWDQLSGKATVFLYGSQSELDAALMHQIPGIGARPLSAAHYTTGARPLIPKAWKDYVLWQYTGSGRVPGIDGDCDRYRFRGTLEELRAFGRAR